MSETQKTQESQASKATVTLPATVEKIIPAIGNHKPEQAQIAVDGGEELYREIRVENTLEDESGNPVALKVGAQIEVTIEADAHATTPKKQQESSKCAGSTAQKNKRTN